MLLPYVFALGALIVAAIAFWGGYAEERHNSDEPAPPLSRPA